MDSFAFILLHLLVCATWPLGAALYSHADKDEDEFHNDCKVNQ